MLFPTLDSQAYPFIFQVTLTLYQKVKVTTGAHRSRLLFASFFQSASGSRGCSKEQVGTTCVGHTFYVAAGQVQEQGSRRRRMVGELLQVSRDSQGHVSSARWGPPLLRPCGCTRALSVGGAEKPRAFLHCTVLRSVSWAHSGDLLLGELSIPRL